MKITVFNGSPNAERGNTHVMVEAFLQGAKEAGAEVENVFLAQKQITPCNGCYACWMKTPGQCAFQDDMDELLPKFVSSSIVGFATPLYVDNVTGLMKNFMDRLIPIGDPHIEKDEHGESRHVKRYDKPTKLIAISNCGFPEQSHFQVLRVLFRRIARNLSCELIAEIYRGAGAILRSPEPILQQFLESYKQLLRTAGKEVVTGSKLSDDTIAQLEKPLIPMPNFADEYMKRANRMYDERLSKLDK
ncbi:MAG: flavodoxin family protein [Candidatus Zixiibacteriota bacterium]